MNKALALAAVLTVSLLLSAPCVLAFECKADMNCDGKVNASDLGIFKQDYGKINCDPSPACMFTCEGTLSPLGRWCDQGDGTVKDMTTGLVWLKNASWGGQHRMWVNTMDGVNAQIRCDQLWDGSPWEGTAGLSDGSRYGEWDLPTWTELQALRDGIEPISYGHPYLFTGVRNDYYWSGTTDVSDSDKAVAYDMGGLLVPSELLKDNYCFVWPVRSAN
jgi:hypothetical protein